MTPSSFYSPPTSQLVEPSQTYYVSPTSNYMISPPHSVLMTPKSETFAPILPPIDNLFTGNFSLHKHNIGQYQSVDDLFNEVVLEQDEYGGFHTMNETFIRHDMNDLKRFSENVTITTVDDANYNPEQEPSDELQTSKTNNFTSEFQLNFDINEPQFTKSHACPYKGCKNTYTRAYTLKLHVAASHQNLKPHKCTHPGCDLRFARKHDLVRHAQVHTSERLHQCTSCLKKFRRKDHLTIHSRGTRCAFRISSSS
ncbi:hypothetical protein BC833DRAFT_549382 [Globomyces pollinis-pini]|nr:hypothetical protein BC833DRAFT_549382 [Globomyces pollinis-pini]